MEETHHHLQIMRGLTRIFFSDEGMHNAFGRLEWYLNFNTTQASKKHLNLNLHWGQSKGSNNGEQKLECYKVIKVKQILSFLIEKVCILITN